METKQREIKYEILRILAMGMIIALHYLSKGGFLNSLKGEVSVADCLAWLIEAFCLVAVNVYVLISGYFGCESDWKIKKLFTLWSQVIFYALAVGVFVLFTGLADRSSFNLYEGIKLICPIVTEHYWFATAYILLFIMMPFLKAGIDKLTRKELVTVIGVLLLFQSIMKSILPIHLPWDKLGYDAWWFVTLFLIGAYIRKYGLTILNKKTYCLILYIGFCFLIFTQTMGIRFVYHKTGRFEDFLTYAYSYNHIFCLLASIGLFGFFMNLKGRQLQQTTIRRITRVSGATFGVYLLHEHLFIRYQWPIWLGAQQFHGSYYFVLHLLFSIVIVYVAGTVFELIRQKIFTLLSGRR